MATKQFHGWVVVVIGCFISFVELGTFKSFGVFIMPIRESLSGSYSAVGTGMAASHTVCGLCVPLSIYLNGKFGSRRVVIAGGVMLFTSFLLIALMVQTATQFSVFMISFGFGVSLVFTPPFAYILEHFEKVALPIGIVFTGSGLGMMVYPPLTEILIDTYGWRGAMLIYAAVNANICSLGALMKDPPAEYVALESDHQSQEQSPEIGATKLDVLRSHFMDAVKGFWRLLALDLLRKEPMFTLFIFLCFMVGVVYSAWMIYLVPHAVTRGIDIQGASLLSTAGGVGTVVGRIVYGPILHLEYINPVQMFSLLAMANFCAFMLDGVVAANYRALLCLAAVNGISLGTMTVLFAIVSRHILDESRAMEGFGTLSVSFGLGELAGGALAGFTFDSAESYDIIFWMLGGISGAMVIVLVLERLSRLFQKRFSQK